MNRDPRALPIFQQAIGLPPDRVASFLDGACQQDHGLRKDVESLLATFRDPDDFLNQTDLTDVGSKTQLGKPLLPKFKISERLLPDGCILAGRYEIKRSLGAGGMGEVYLATDRGLDRNVAIKTLTLANLADDEMNQRFDREVRSVAALSHPNIVALYDIREEDELKFAVMEYVEGTLLRELIVEGISSRRAAEIAAGIAAGLRAAHELEIMHRDIKPENVMITPADNVKVLDFGLARRVTRRADQDLTGNSLAGTLPYMSPEQVEGQEVNCSTDIFSLGTVLFEMLTGTNPFRDPSALETIRRVAEASPPSVFQRDDEIPRELDTLLTAMLSRDPTLRPSAEEVESRLRTIS